MSEAIQETFYIKDDRMAEWALEKIKEAKHDKEKWTAFYTEQIERVENEAQATIDRMEMYLAEYFRQVPHKVTKTQQSYALPSGKLVLKKQAPEYTRDDTQVIDWARTSCPDAIKVKESLDWAALKKTIVNADDGSVVAADSGEVIPGIAWTERPDVFKVEAKE